MINDLIYNENVDLLEAVEYQSFMDLYENSLNTKELPVVIEDTINEFLIYGYDTYRYIVEAETTAMTTTNYVYGDATEVPDTQNNTVTKKALERFKDIIKSILDKIIKFIGKAKEFIKKISYAVKKKIEDFNIAGNTMIVIKGASVKDKNLTLKRVIVSNDAINFIDKFDGILHNKFIGIVQDSIDEVIDFFKDNNSVKILNDSTKEEKEKYIASKCPKYTEIMKLCDGDSSRLKDVMIANLQLPIGENKDFVIIGEDIPAKNYIQYCPNIEKMLKNIGIVNFSMNFENAMRDFDVRRIERLKSQIDSMRFTYPKISSALGAMLECIMFVLNYANKQISACFMAANAHYDNVIKCIKIVNPKAAERIEKKNQKAQAE